jgi:hypothetical protein
MSRSERCRAGHIVALVYLLCVLAPSFAFAFGEAHLNQHCLFDDGPVAGLSYRSEAPSGETNVHSPNHRPAAHHAGPMHHDHGSMQMAEDSAPAAPHHGHHAAMDQQCCGTPCIAAMAVALTEVATPRPPHVFLLPESGRHLAGSAPALLYRPPIS